MKKSFVVLPLAALVLAGCSSTSSEVESSVATPEWQTDVVQSAEMPSSMSGQTVSQSYPAPQQVSSSGQSEIIGNCQVVRDYDNKPIYSQIQKGCYTDSTYTVGKHDTLFLISYLTARTPQKIARLNGLSTTTKLKVGQTLRIR